MNRSTRGRKLKTIGKIQFPPYPDGVLRREHHQDRGKLKLDYKFKTCILLDIIIIIIIIIDIIYWYIIYWYIIIDIFLRVRKGGREVKKNLSAFQRGSRFSAG